MADMYLLLPTGQSQPFYSAVAEIYLGILMLNLETGHAGEMKVR